MHKTVSPTLALHLLFLHLCTSGVLTILFDPIYLEIYQADSNILRKENTVPLGNFILCCHLEQIIYKLKVFLIIYLRKKKIKLQVKKHFRENFISANH